MTQAIAPLYLRIAARCVDFVLAGLLASAAARIILPRVLSAEDFVTDGLFDFGALLDVLDSPIFLASSIAITSFWEIAWLLYEGATPGKQLFGLFVHDAKSPIGTVRLSSAVRRNVHRLIDVVPFGAIANVALSLVSLVLMTNDVERRQSVMDRAAKTTVHRLKGTNPRFSPWLSVFLVCYLGLRLIAFVADPS